MSANVEEIHEQMVEYVREHADIVDMACDNPRLVFAIAVAYAAMALSFGEREGVEKILKLMPQLVRASIELMESGEGPLH